jgi:hypothetical protein
MDIRACHFNAARHAHARVNTDTGFHPEMPLTALLS